MNTRTVARKVEIVQTTSGRRYTVVEVPSESNPDRMYRVDVTAGRCSCPGWKFHARKDGSRSPCKHLRRFGYVG